MAVTLKALARLAGVHPSTVARVLNGDPQQRVSDEVRGRIVALAEQHGYQPNHLARALRLKRSRVIGTIIPDIANPFFAVLFAVLLLLGSCRFALTGVYEASGIAATEKAAGWLGVPLAVFALYGGLALLLEEGSRRTVLPLGRRGTARISVEGDLGHQIQHASREPGVRRQL